MRTKLIMTILHLGNSDKFKIATEAATTTTTTTTLMGGNLSVMVIVIGNGIGNQSSNPGRSYLYFTSC